jgi:hypothetical protein
MVVFQSLQQLLLLAVLLPTPHMTIKLAPYIAVQHQEIPTLQMVLPLMNVVLLQTFSLMEQVSLKSLYYCSLS